MHALDQVAVIEGRAPRPRGVRRWLRRLAISVAVLVLALASVRLASLWYVGRIGWYRGAWIEVEAAPGRGFHWPYRLYVPAALISGAPARLWVRPNNTGVGAHDDFAVHDADAAALLAVSRWEAEALAAVVLVPSFPRPRSQWRLYTHALDRDTALADPPLGALDRQLLAMIDDATERVRALGHPVCERSFFDGFSAAGMFVSRFTLLHPERVQAAAVGAPGGWPMVPVAEDLDVGLPYPIGLQDYSRIAGRPPLIAALTSVPRVFYMGDADTNDSVPFADAYDEEHSALLRERFGATPRERWDDALRLHAGTNAVFWTYPGVGHTVTRTMQRDVQAFLAHHDDRDACP